MSEKDQTRTSSVLAVYPLCARAMHHVAQHDVSEVDALLEEISGHLAAVQGRSVAEPLAALRAAWDVRDWSATSTRLYQLTCVLPFGFPSDPTHLPPQAGEVPLVWTPCPDHPDNPSWQRFCPSCGAPAWEPRCAELKTDTATDRV